MGEVKIGRPRSVPEDETRLETMQRRARQRNGQDGPFPPNMLVCANCGLRLMERSREDFPYLHHATGSVYCYPDKRATPRRPVV